MLVITGEVGAPCGNTLRFTFSHSPFLFLRSTSISVQQIEAMIFAIFKRLDSGILFTSQSEPSSDLPSFVFMKLLPSRTNFCFSKSKLVAV